ncbi:hypothetical protein [Cognatilysobacter lacus]|uniref:HEAT repeat domain-containing protein n=1 Tax=Cognatilysobacter lacus TaxID=1643323 RepID=A0A5D8ZAQ2_9GAMM|nr:hypothetical protein [Lysobacter lacus]TZF89754.1 hypothetical protein FW784_08015 [Lysobacter lacus]
MDEFSRHVHGEERDAWLENAAPAWARQLSRDDAEQVSATALADPSFNVRVFGVQLLFDRVSEARGAQAAAELVIRGDDLTPLLWSWMHASPAGTVERRLDMIRAELEARKGGLAPEQRQRVDRLLCPPGKRCR